MRLQERVKQLFSKKKQFIYSGYVDERDTLYM